MQIRLQMKDRHPEMTKSASITQANPSSMRVVKDGPAVSGEYWNLMSS